MSESGPPTVEDAEPVPDPCIDSLEIVPVGFDALEARFGLERLLNQERSPMVFPFLGVLATSIARVGAPQSPY